MAAGPTISQQKIIAAAKHDPNMIEVLQQLAQAGRSSKPSLARLRKPAQRQDSRICCTRPAQARGTVSILNKSYIVQLVNPGGTSPISQLQAQQAAGGATPLTPLQPVTPILHQIRASTSAAFNVNSNTQTFGGNTGSTQTYWTLTGLGSGTWFVQFRSSFDGINWNKWKNANGGTALGGLINEVTTENPGNSEWALFSLPSGLIMGIGAGLMADQEVFDLAEEVYSSGMIAIAGPNGLSSVGSSAFGVTLCDVDLQTPAVPPPGIPDLPVEIRMQYGEHSTSGTWPGNASVFAIAFDPTNENVTLYEEPGGSTVWAAFRLPGGARIAIGQGKNTHGDTLWTPPALTWFNWVRSMSISSFTDATDTGATPHGYYSNKIAAGVRRPSITTSRQPGRRKPTGWRSPGSRGRTFKPSQDSRGSRFSCRVAMR